MNTNLTPLFALRGTLTPRQKLIAEIAGAFALVGAWYGIVALDLVPARILPWPHRVILAFPELHYDDALVRNAMYSIKINLFGNLQAIVLAVPLGMILGLFVIPRSMVERAISAVRYLPLPPVIGIFIALFGIATNLKVQFLAFAIFVYLLPVVIQRVDEVLEVYAQTAKTLGATRWQTIKTVFVPDVASRVFGDIIVLNALSWTYITFAELINANDGGVVALAYIAARQSRPDKAYAVLFTIIFIGFCLDKLLKIADKQLFPHKYVKGG